MSRRHDVHDGRGGIVVIPGRGIIQAQGTTVPADGADGYAPGCIFQHVDGGDNTALYVNEGTNTTADFNLVAIDVGIDLTGLLATATEINRSSDVSTRLIAGGSALTLTVAAHDGKICLWDTAAGTTFTLPAATGTGARFRFVISVIATSNSHIVKVANGTDIIQGVILGISDAGNAELGWIAASTDDTITLNRTTSGSVTRGEWVEIIDVASGLFLCTGSIAQNGVEVTPFSATVA